MSKLKKSSNDILNTKFKAVRAGYDPFEVDMFLDGILSDYRTIESGKILSESEYNEIHNRLMELEEKVKTLEIENASFRAKFGNIKQSDNVTTDNINLIRRINALEKFIFQIGYDPTKIK